MYSWFVVKTIFLNWIFICTLGVWSRIADTRIICGSQSEVLVIRSSSTSVNYQSSSAKWLVPYFRAGPGKMFKNRCVYDDVYTCIGQKWQLFAIHAHQWHLSLSYLFISVFYGDTRSWLLWVSSNLRHGRIRRHGKLNSSTLFVYCLATYTSSHTSVTVYLYRMPIKNLMSQAFGCRKQLA